MEPRYTTKAATTIVNSIPYPAGVEVTIWGWPPRDVEPVNEQARRIAEYHQKHRADPWLAKSPFHAGAGLIYLPALLVNAPDRYHPSVATPRESPGVAHYEAPGMPEYRIEHGPVRLGNQSYGTGAMVKFLAWPRPSLIPANEAAEKVIAYFERYRDNPHLPPSPWNLFDDTLFLPGLAEPTPVAPSRPLHSHTPPAWPSFGPPEMEEARVYSRDPSAEKYQPRRMTP